MAVDAFGTFAEARPGGGHALSGGGCSGVGGSSYFGGGGSGGLDAFGLLGAAVYLVTGEAVPLGPAQREVTAAVTIPRSPNVLLLALDGAEAWLRVV